eukprot:TRINITY_DN8682_c0_g1_i1.p1 TRINITY_DN8682_c0_g1~~TRINITY_DN8682_c0_g1_i1.p1  ORF type:complete len:453 (-),score=72.58 TRINITY_DN8682_c0_g1_i1:23-1381(-)
MHFKRKLIEREDDVEASYLVPNVTNIKPNSWKGTSSLIIAAMAGAGVLGIPLAVNMSGWIGIVILIFCGIFSNITSNLLGDLMNRITYEEVKDYSSIGEFAFGRAGKIATNITQYITLSGVTIIFLILVGILMHAVEPCIPAKFYTILGGLLTMILTIALPNMKEAKWISFFGIFTTLVTVIVSCIVSILFFTSSDYELEREVYEMDHSYVNINQIPTAFSIFAFAFGGHSLLPNLYAEMRSTHEWYKATNLSYNAVLLILYLPVAIIGYAVYGSYLGTSGASDILEVLDNPSFGSAYKIPVSIAEILLIMHLASVLPIVSNPILKRVERIFTSQDDSFGDDITVPLVKRILFRCSTIAVLTIIALFFPFFLQMVGIITSLSVVCDVYIFPVLFSWRINPPKSYAMSFLLFFILVWGVVGSITGLISNVNGLIEATKQSDPFSSDMFKFTCS